jgi:arsenate reductase (thioredoxin)
MKKERVVFICTGNSARSQMAEGYLRHIASDRFEVFSGGLEPRPIHPFAIEVMDEIGIDIRSQSSKDIKRYLGKETFHHAVFVCQRAEQNCPRIYPFAMQTQSWPFEDPALAIGNQESKFQKFREVRDQIIARITSWVEDWSQPY